MTIWCIGKTGIIHEKNCAFKSCDTHYYYDPWRALQNGKRFCRRCTIDKAYLYLVEEAYLQYRDLPVQIEDEFFFFKTTYSYWCIDFYTMYLWHCHFPNSSDITQEYHFQKECSHIMDAISYGINHDRYIPFKKHRKRKINKIYHDIEHNRVVENNRKIIQSLIKEEESHGLYHNCRDQSLLWLRDISY